jgi:hypothetical protein
MENPIGDTIGELLMKPASRTPWLSKTRAYLDNGFLELGNNTVERAVKPVARVHPAIERFPGLCGRPWKCESLFGQFGHVIGCGRVSGL